MRAVLLPPTASGIAALNAGLFVDSGHGAIHPARTIGSHELLVVRRGGFAMRVGDATCELGPGERLLLPAGVPHAGVSPYRRGTEFFWLHFRLRGARGVALTTRAPLARPEVVEELARRYLDDQEAGQLGAAAAASLVHLLLVEAARPALPDPRVSLLAARARHWLRCHCRQPVSTREAAEALRVHPDHLGREFRLATGASVVEWLQRERVRMAKLALLESPAAVTAIARECGFATATHFRRVFARATGMSPRAWRRIHARAHVNDR